MLYNYLLILLTVLIIAIGQLLFKMVGTRLGSGGFEVLMHDFRAAFLLVAALSIYFVATFMYIWALRQVPLSNAYLFMSLGFVIVPLLSWYFLGEHISERMMVGSVLIIAGVALSASTQS